MAKNTEALARVRITVGGVEATKANLKKLEDASAQLNSQIRELEQRKVEFVAAGDIEKANELTKRIDGLNVTLEQNRKIIDIQKQELGQYENILDGLSGRTLRELRQGMGVIRGKMAWNLSMDDIDKYRELKDAYDQINESIKQLSGKAPNINYVLSNVSKVSAKTLKDSIEYVRKMISETDEGSKRIVQLRTELGLLEQEQRFRLLDNVDIAVKNVTGKPFAGTEAEAKQALETLQEYKASLKMSTQADEIERVRTAMEAYNVALEKVKDTALDVSKVLADPKNYSIDQIERAIKQLEEDGKRIKIADTDALQKNVEDVERLKDALTEAVNSDTFIDKIVWDAAKGEASVEDLEKAIAAVKERMRRSRDATVTEQLRQTLDKLNPALELTKTSLTRVNATLGNIKGSNLGSLKEAASRLRAELNDVNISMDEFAAKGAQLKKVTAQIRELESRARGLGEETVGFTGKLQSMLLSVVGASELMNRAMQAVQDNLKLSDAMTDVQKTTGLAADEVERLTDEIQALDTRITNEDLMEAAAEAGRIGLKTRQEVFEFTRASAITLTALDELDAKAITSVMKLNALLGETQRLGVQQAILSTASSINELSAASSASAGPIIDFARRVGGVASQANISTAEVLGLGATLDALGQTVEVSSTAISKMTTALLTNGEQIAEDTGLSKEYVNEMLRQGKTVELMVEVLTRLNSMGGIGEISKYMGNLGGEGARMASVISALASNLDLLREQIDLSKLSFEEGISVINEYNMKNENAAAIVARMGNEIKEFAVNSSFVDKITNFVGVLQQFVHWMLSSTNAATAFRWALGYLVAHVLNGIKIFAGFTASVRAWAAGLFVANTATASATKQVGFFSKAMNAVSTSIAAAKLSLDRFIVNIRLAHTFGGLFTAGMTAVTLSVKGLTKALASLFASNPLGWIVIAVSYLSDFLFASKEVEKQIDMTKSAVDRANESFEEESYKLTKLRQKLDEANDTSLTAQKRATLMQEVVSALNRDYGEHIGYVIDLAAGERELAAALDLARIAMKKQALEQERTKVSQNVRDKYRDQTTDAANEVKGSLDTFIRNAYVGNQMYRMTDNGLTDLYNAMMTEIVESSRLSEDGVAKLGEKTDAVLQTQAKALAGGDEALEKELLEVWRKKLRGSDEIKAVQDLYTRQMKEIKEGEGDIARIIGAEDKAYTQTLQKSIDSRQAGALMEKKAVDFNEQDEKLLKGLIGSHEKLLETIDAEVDPTRWKEVDDQLQAYRNKQTEVLRSFSEDPLKGVKMKVGDDGKLYRDTLENGHLQYVSVKELGDANLEMLRQAYVKTESTFQQLNSDFSNRMDAQVIEQANKLSKVKTAIKKYLAENGMDIDKDGNITIRDTEFSGGSGSGSSVREQESDGRKAYKELEDKLKAHYDRERQITLEAFVNSNKSVEWKNMELERIDREHKETLIAMQDELLGEAKDVSLFDEATLIGDPKLWKKALDFILTSTRGFASDVRKQREELKLENLEMQARQKEDVQKILLQNNYQAQVDKEMQEALERTGLFWGKNQKQTEERGKAILQELRKHMGDAYKLTAAELKDRLSLETEYGSVAQELTKEQQEALLVLLQQYLDKDLEARRKHKEQVMKDTETSWDISGGKHEYETGMGELESRKRNVEIRRGNGAMSEKEAFEERQKILLEELELEEKAYRFKIENANNEEARLEYEEALAEREREIQEELTEAYLEEYNRRADKYSEYAQKFGEFLGVMGSAAWNSVEDRKKAGEELLKYIAQETAEYIRELLVRKVKEEMLRKAGIGEMEKGEKEKQDIQQKGVDISTQIAEKGGEALIQVEQFTTGTVGQMAESGAAQSATTAVKEAQVKGAAGIAGGAAKTISELGFWGIPLIAAIEGVISMLLNMAMSALSSSFGSSTSTAKTNKRLATGMLTYASGRYPVEGDDGVTYDAQYEPRLQTKIYQGGKGKAHMALFSEVMPEMVISGPTTKIIQEDFPALMNAILTIDKYGTLPQPRRMRRYEAGNLDEFDVDMQQGADGTFAESPAIAELRQSNAELRDTVARLATILENGIHANINMYGKGGIKESMDKANKFYTKNRIK